MRKRKRKESTKIHDLPLREFIKVWRTAKPRNWQAKQAAAELGVNAKGNRQSPSTGSVSAASTLSHHFTRRLRA